MKSSENFVGTPWNAEPNASWNQTPYWREYYSGLLDEAGEDWQREYATFKDLSQLLTQLLQQNAFPLRADAPRPRFLDAGCGIALTPDVLAHWGLDVTAVDLSETAIDFGRNRTPSESELARCIWIWEPVPNTQVACQLMKKPLRSLEILRQRHMPDGKVHRVKADWLDPSSVCGPFDFIRCDNGLRQSTKPYWRKTLSRFYELLGKGGVLLLETVNAVGIEEEVKEIVDEIGFHRLHDSENRHADRKNVLERWPTG